MRGILLFSGQNCLAEPAGRTTDFYPQPWTLPFIESKVEHSGHGYGSDYGYRPVQLLVAVWGVGRV